MLHVGDYGGTTPFLLSLVWADKSPVDVSGATVYIHFRKPSGEVLTVTAEFVNDGTDGLVRYIFQEDDLSESGKWQAQAEAVWPVAVHHSDVMAFTVGESIGD